MFFILFIVLFSSFPLMAQGNDAKYQITQFTTKEGLLSNTVHEVVLDEEGFLWIAMDGGLMRFYGSNFRSYGKEVALENHTLIHMQLDSKGNLWMHSTSGDVFVKSKGNDKINYYRFNDKVRSIFRNSAGFSRKLFYVDTLGNLYLENLSKDEVYSIDSDGFITILSNDKQPGTDVITLPDGHYIPVPNLKNKSGVQYFASGNSGRQLNFDERIHEVRYNGLHFEVPYNMDYLTTSANAIFQINEDTLVHYCCGKVSVFTEDTLFSQEPSGLILDFKTSDEREIFAGYHYGEGVVVAKDLQAFTKGVFANFLKSYSVTSISVAGNNSFWVGTLEGGIFYFKQPIVFSVFKDMKIISLKNVGDSLLFITPVQNDAKMTWLESLN